MNKGLDEKKLASGRFYTVITISVLSIFLLFDFFGLITPDVNDHNDVTKHWRFVTTEFINRITARRNVSGSKILSVDSNSVNSAV